ncbi:hypothetical protein [Trichocoleus sp. DQ-U1]|uniref:hypothetical protein n=1 Tax=Trichocoleus sp. DQ-U1 TaxID=2933926 RepID=UPI0032983448
MKITKTKAFRRLTRVGRSSVGRSLLGVSVATQDCPNWALMMRQTWCRFHPGLAVASSTDLSLLGGDPAVGWDVVYLGSD